MTTEIKIKRIKLKEESMWCEIIPDYNEPTIQNFYIYNEEYVEMMYCFGLHEADVRIFQYHEDVLEEVLTGYIQKYYESYECE